MSENEDGALTGKNFPPGITERRRPFWVDLAAAYIGGIASSATWEKWPMVAAWVERAVPPALAALGNVLPAAMP